MSASIYIPSLLLAGLMIGCNDDVGSSDAKKDVKKNSFLVSADSVNSIPVNMLQSLAAYSGQTAVADLVRHGVTTWRIRYNTTYQDRTVEASGLLYVPQQLSSPAPIISLQHGTTFEKNGAPSVKGDYTGMEYFASAGYIASMPDYLGYGSSSDVFHPYYDKTYSASSVIDMLKAVREFLKEKEIPFNDDLFLAGYSEGGYVTLATAQELEQNKEHGFTVNAVAAGAGGYDLSHMLASITTGTYYAYPAYLAFVLMSYNNTYNWNKPLSYFFQDKYARVLEEAMNGTYSGWQINNRLTTNTTALLNPNFLARLRTPDGEKELKDALVNNSTGGWASSLSIRLYHGTKDEIIPYANSEVTLKNFRRLNTKDIKLTLIPGGTHSSSFMPMLQDFIPWFEGMRK